MATGRADEAVRPSQPFQVVEAVRISREPSLKLPKGPRVVDAGEGSLHPSSIRLSPVKWIAQMSDIGHTGLRVLADHDSRRDVGATIVGTVFRDRQRREIDVRADDDV